MRSFILNKLVRDNILADMQQTGQNPTAKKLSKAEFKAALAAKLREEASEFKIDDHKEAIKELADVMEVIDAIIEELGINPEELRSAQAERRQKRGGFKQRTFVERVTMEDDSPWATYYGSEPERFKEIRE